MKVVQEETHFIRSMDSGEMQTRTIDVGGGWWEVEYFVPRTSQWKLVGKFLSLEECGIRLNAFIAMHNKILIEK